MFDYIAFLQDQIRGLRSFDEVAAAVEPYALGLMEDGYPEVVLFVVRPSSKDEHTLVPVAIRVDDAPENQAQICALVARTLSGLQGAIAIGRAEADRASLAVADWQLVFMTIAVDDSARGRSQGIGSAKQLKCPIGSPPDDRIELRDLLPRPRPRSSS